MVIAEDRIGGFARSKGKERADLSSAEVSIYELELGQYREFMICRDEVAAARLGARHLPEVVVVGLISTYDAFLADLLRVVAKRQPGTFLTPDKTLKFSELTNFSSIDEARSYLIDKEIESLIRQSHHEQFDWMQKRFDVKLCENLPVWPKFVELCERRNLLTHTGGIVSKQYLEVCKEHKCNIEKVALGEKLTVNAEYFREAVGIIYEIGVKLCHVFWRKFAKEERKEADRALNELGYDLIYGRAYPVAEAILNFGDNVLKTHYSDSTRRMIVINLANAIRLQERPEDAKLILDREDWSACSEEFKICVAAVRGEVDTVVQLANAIGTGGRPTLEHYRTWPVFRGMRTEEKFILAVEQIFGEPLIPDVVDKVEVDADPGETPPENGTTVH